MRCYLSHNVASEGSDEPAHPHSLARDIAADIQNERAYSPTRWLCIIHQRTSQQTRKKCSKRRLVSRLNLYLNLRYNSAQFGI